MSSLIRQHRSRLYMFLLNGALVTASFLSPATFCRTALGAEVKIIPACEFNEEFNDNVFLGASDKKSDFITTLTPSLEFASNSERMNIDLFTGLRWHNYAQTKGIGTTDYLYTAQVTDKLTPRDDLGLNAMYVRNTRLDNITQTTGLSTNTGSDHSQYSASVRRVLDETTAASLAYSFTQDTYDSPDFQPNHVHNAGLVVSKDLGRVLPLLNGTLSTNFSRAIYRDSSSDIYTVSVGASRNINEKINVNLAVGGQLIHSSFVATSEVSNDSWEPIGSASLNYTGEKSFGSVAFARNFSAASGQVGAVETTSFKALLGRSLDDKSTAQVEASYNINQASSGQFSARSADARVLNVKADIVYNINKYFDIGLQYTFYTVNYALNDLSVTRNSIMLRAIAKFPFIR